MIERTYQYDSAEWLVRRYEQAKTLRNPHEAEWHRSARYCLPQDLAMWQSMGDPGVGTRQSASLPTGGTYDATAKLALPKFVAICHRLATPKSQIWHRLTANNADLMKIRAVQLYFDELNTTLWKRRYDPKARFSTAQSENYAGLGAYGNGTKFIAERRVTPLNPRKGIFYRSVHMGDIFVMVDEEGNVDTLFRRLRLTPRQAAQKFPKDRLPEVITSKLDLPDKGDASTYEFFQAVMPREDFDAARMDGKRFPLASVYVSIEGKCIVDEPGGYRSWPFIMSRHFTAPSGIYGLGPASLAREAMGSSNAIKRNLLKQGEKAVNPTLLAHDDGVVAGSFDLRPGAINPGGVNSQGQRLVHTLETGNFQVGENLLQDERFAIEDSFLVKLFQIFVQTPEMTATEVMERISEKASFVAPVMERLQSEDLGPMIERELDVLGAIDALPEMPPELIEAEGEYDVIYTSPLARSQNAEQVSGFMRITEMATAAAQATGDSKPLRRINFDTAIPEIAEVLSVPPRWLRSDDEVEAAAAGDQEAMQVDQLAQAAPAIAGVMKAANQGAPKR